MRNYLATLQNSLRLALLCLLVSISLTAEAADEETCLLSTEARLQQIRDGETPADKTFRNNFDSLRLAIEDLMQTHGTKYPKGKSFLQRLTKLEKAVGDSTAPIAPLAKQFDQLFNEALLANPLMDFDKLLFIEGNQAYTPKNWLNIVSIPGKKKHDHSLNVLSPVTPDGKVTQLFTPPVVPGIAQMDLHWEGDKLLYSGIGEEGRWQLREIDLPPKQGPEGQPIVRKIETIPGDPVHNFDGCYTPDGSIIFCSTATMLGVPCIRGNAPIANLYRKLSPEKGGRVERLTHGQENEWHTTVLPNGRVMYLRWEYSDLSHCFARIVFSMNPDGTGQAAMYGSNSYWPNSVFYPKPLPGSSTKFCGIVTGHHDQAQIGHLTLFDTAKGRHEADGAIQEIPGYGKKVEPIILDGLTRGRLPLFLTPYPLSDKYFLVAMQTQAKSPTAIYLVDIFDNALKLCEKKGRYLFEPVPWRATERAPIIFDKTDPEMKTATVMVNNVLAGEGLKGVQPGKIKNIRLSTYNFSYRYIGGQVDRVGLDGPWDVRVILGTVPVEDDGSASFTVPAMLPISLQPLDEEGKAVQWMRSWITCRPGEVLSCVGCHENPNSTPELQTAKAALREPSPIKPWYGPARGFSFNREVQPVLDKYCVSCHNAETDKKGRNGEKIANLTLQPDVGTTTHKLHNLHYSPSYYALRQLVRGPSMEGDLHMLATYDVHADQTHLVRMLKKGHHNVKLDKEAWSRLVTWIDLNAPAHGSWTEIAGTQRVDRMKERRDELMKLYGNVTFDPEVSFLATDTTPKFKPVKPAKLVRPASIRDKFPPKVVGKAEKKEMVLPLNEKLSLKLVKIPAGEYVAGNVNGAQDEFREQQVKISEPFWIGTCEITNEQYALFDPSHDSRLEHGDFLHFADIPARGTLLNEPQQPVARISQQQALAFCEWLSKKTGKKVTLPTEQQWEWAARFGRLNDAPFQKQGFANRDFSKLANLADIAFHETTSRAVPSYRPGIESVDDGNRVSAPVASFEPDEAGVYDLTGNVAEWTTSEWVSPLGEKLPPHSVAKGGSWRDLPHNAGAGSRMPLRPEMTFLDVGFRVIVEE